MKQNYIIIITDISKIIGVVYSFRKSHVEEGVINGEIRLHAKMAVACGFLVYNALYVLLQLYLTPTLL